MNALIMVFPGPVVTAPNSIFKTDLLDKVGRYASLIIRDPNDAADAALVPCRVVKDRFYPTDMRATENLGMTLEAHLRILREQQPVELRTVPVGRRFHRAVGDDQVLIRTERITIGGSDNFYAMALTGQQAGRAVDLDMSTLVIVLPESEMV